MRENINNPDMYRFDITDAEKAKFLDCQKRINDLEQNAEVDHDYEMEKIIYGKYWDAYLSANKFLIQHKGVKIKLENQEDRFILKLSLMLRDREDHDLKNNYCFEDRLIMASLLESIYLQEYEWNIRRNPINKCISLFSEYLIPFISKSLIKAGLVFIKNSSKSKIDNSNNIGLTKNDITCFFSEDEIQKNFEKIISLKLNDESWKYCIEECLKRNSDQGAVLSEEELKKLYTTIQELRNKTAELMDAGEKIDLVKKEIQAYMETAKKNNVPNSVLVSKAVIEICQLIQILQVENITGSSEQKNAVKAIRNDLERSTQAHLFDIDIKSYQAITPGTFNEITEKIYLYTQKHCSTTFYDNLYDEIQQKVDRNKRNINIRKNIHQSLEDEIRGVIKKQEELCESIEEIINGSQLKNLNIISKVLASSQVIPLPLPCKAALAIAQTSVELLHRYQGSQSQSITNSKSERIQGYETSIRNYEVLMNHNQMLLTHLHDETSNLEWQLAMSEIGNPEKRRESIEVMIDDLQKQQDELTERIKSARSQSQRVSQTIKDQEEYVDRLEDIAFLKDRKKDHERLNQAEQQLANQRLEKEKYESASQDLNEKKDDVEGRKQTMQTHLERLEETAFIDDWSYYQKLRFEENQFSELTDEEKNKLLNRREAIRDAFRSYLSCTNENFETAHSLVASLTKLQSVMQIGGYYKASHVISLLGHGIEVYRNYKILIEHSKPLLQMLYEQQQSVSGVLQLLGKQIFAQEIMKPSLELFVSGANVYYLFYAISIGLNSVDPMLSNIRDLFEQQTKNFGEFINQHFDVINNKIDGITHFLYRIGNEISSVREEVAFLKQVTESQHIETKYEINDIHRLTITKSLIEDIEKENAKVEKELTSLESFLDQPITEQNINYINKKLLKMMTILENHLDSSGKDLYNGNLKLQGLKISELYISQSPLLYLDRIIQLIFQDKSGSNKPGFYNSPNIMMFLVLARATLKILSDLRKMGNANDTFIQSRIENFSDFVNKLLVKGSSLHEFFLSLNPVDTINIYISKQKQYIDSILEFIDKSKRNLNHIKITTKVIETIPLDYTDESELLPLQIDDEDISTLDLYFKEMLFKFTNEKVELFLDYSTQKGISNHVAINSEFILLIPSLYVSWLKNKIKEINKYSKDIHELVLKTGNFIAKSSKNLKILNSLINLEIKEDVLVIYPEKNNSDLIPLLFPKSYINEILIKADLRCLETFEVAYRIVVTDKIILQLIFSIPDLNQDKKSLFAYTVATFDERSFRGNWCIQPYDIKSEETSVQSLLYGKNQINYKFSLYHAVTLFQLYYGINIKESPYGIVGKCSSSVINGLVLNNSTSFNGGIFSLLTKAIGKYIVFDSSLHTGTNKSLSFRDSPIVIVNSEEYHKISRKNRDADKELKKSLMTSISEDYASNFEIMVSLLKINTKINYKKIISQLEKDYFLFQSHHLIKFLSENSIDDFKSIISLFKKSDTSNISHLFKFEFNETIQNFLDYYEQLESFKTNQSALILPHRAYSGDSNQIYYSDLKKRENMNFSLNLLLPLVRSQSLIQKNLIFFNNDPYEFFEPLPSCENRLPRACFNNLYLNKTYPGSYTLGFISNDIIKNSSDIELFLKKHKYLIKGYNKEGLNLIALMIKNFKVCCEDNSITNQSCDLDKFHFSNYKAIINLLIELGADINHENPLTLKTVLDFALDNANDFAESLLLFLIESGAKKITVKQHSNEDFVRLLNGYDFDIEHKQSKLCNIV